MNPKTYEDAVKRQPRLRGLIEDGGVSVHLVGDVPDGYVRDVTTGTIYRLETWLFRVGLGLNQEENAEVGEQK